MAQAGNITGAKAVLICSDAGEGEKFYSGAAMKDDRRQWSDEGGEGGEW